MAPVLTLVHSPLVGPATWDSLAPALDNRGYETLIPDLTQSVVDGPPFWPKQVEAILDLVGSRPTILVGHSGAGPLLPSAGATLSGVEGYVFVDAAQPFPGQTWFESAPSELAEHLRSMTTDGWLPPWSQWWGPGGLDELLPDPDVRERFVAGCPRLPLAMFQEVYPPTPSWPDAPGGYLRLSEAYQESADKARALGWPVIELASHHLAVLTDAPAVLGPLLDLLGQLGP